MLVIAEAMVECIASRQSGPAQCHSPGWCGWSIETRVPPVSFGWRCRPRIWRKSPCQTVRTPSDARWVMRASRSSTSKIAM